MEFTEKEKKLLGTMFDKLVEWLNEFDEDAPNISMEELSALSEKLNVQFPSERTKKMKKPLGEWICKGKYDVCSICGTELHCQTTSGIIYRYCPMCRNPMDTDNY